MKRFFSVAMVSLFISLQSMGQANPSVLAYIEQYKNIAMEEMVRTGVPASITLAQGILESQAGKSELAVESNNHFGIKCKAGWTGNVYYYDDDAKQECFRSYNSPEESFKDHSDFLRNRPNYSSLFNLPVDDYQAWAKGLKKAGYATNPVYAQQLIKYVNDYNLQQYTLLALQMKKGDNETFATNNPVKPPELAPAKAAEEERVYETGDAVANSTVEEKKYPDGVFTINQKKVVYAREGVSLFALASTYSVPYKKLLDFNELNNIDILNHPTLVFLEKKPKRGENEFHVVMMNETIETIAQAEGVQLESLMEYNHLVKGNQPAVGQKIYLQPEAPALANKNARTTR